MAETLILLSAMVIYPRSVKTDNFISVFWLLVRELKEDLHFFFQTVNFDATKGYLDLIITYVSIMILLSRVDDRRSVLGLFNFAYELLHGKA